MIKETFGGNTSNIIFLFILYYNLIEFYASVEF